MQTLRVAGFAVLVSALSSTAIIAAEPPGEAAREMPAVLTAVGMTSIATVEAIDMQTREVTLRQADGEVVSFIASDEVRNLAQVAVGDQVVVEYDVGLVMALSPATGQVRQRVDRVEAGRAEPGQKPAGVVRKTVEATATVMAVDQRARMVTLKGAKRTVTLPVSNDIDITTVKVGDQVNAVYQESLAISVRPAPAGK